MHNPAPARNDNIDPPAPSPREDPQLLAAFARQRDQDAFRILVERHHRLVYSVCYQALNRNAASADDATQSVFILLARKAAQINGNNLPNWLFKTSRFVVQGMQRKEWRLKRRERLVAQDARPAVEDALPDPAEQQMVGRVLHQAIARLPALQREALLLCYFDGLDPAQAALLLGVEGQTVRMRVHHALTSLRQKLSYNRAIAGLLVAGTVEGLLTQVTSAAVPAGLATRCHAAALSASAATAAMQIANQTLHYAAVKTATTVGASILIAGSLAVGTFAVYSTSYSGNAPAPVSAPLASPVAAPLTTPDPSPPPPATEPATAPSNIAAAPPALPDPPEPATQPAPTFPPARSAGSPAGIIWRPTMVDPSRSNPDAHIRPEDQVNRKWDLFPPE